MNNFIPQIGRGGGGEEGHVPHIIHSHIQSYLFSKQLFLLASCTLRPHALKKCEYQKDQTFNLVFNYFKSSSKNVGQQMKLFLLNQRFQVRVIGMKKFLTESVSPMGLMRRECFNLGTDTKWATKKIISNQKIYINTRFIPTYMALE